MNSTETISTTTNATAGPQAAPVMPKASKATRKATSKKQPPKAAKGAKKPVAKSTVKKAAKPGAKKAATAKLPREFSKKAIVLDLLRRKAGATMAEIMTATDWQVHSVRGFISGALGKKMGLKVESTKNDAGDRCYRIAGK
jgi:hypothetical protein